jgi:TAP-like protein
MDHSHFPVSGFLMAIYLELDLELLPVLAADRRAGPAPGPVDRAHLGTGAGRGQLLRPGKPLSGRRGGVAVAAEFETALVRRLGARRVLLADNQCVDSYVTRYLLTGRVPAAGTVCRPSASPFAPAVRATSVGPALNAAVIPGPVRQALRVG